MSRTLLIPCLIVSSLIGSLAKAQEDEATSSSDTENAASVDLDSETTEDIEDLATEDEEGVDVNVLVDGKFMIVVELAKDDRVLNGELLDVEDLKLQTAFGVAAIPKEEILAIRLAREVGDFTTVVLHNGDMITGDVEIGSLMVLTRWGRSEVNGSSLASIFFREGLTWKKLKLLAGERWTVEEAIEDAPAPVRASASNRKNNPTLVVQR